MRRHGHRLDPRARRAARLALDRITCGRGSTASPTRSTCGSRSPGAGASGRGPRRPPRWPPAAGDVVIDYEYPEPVPAAGDDDRLADGPHRDRDLRRCGPPTTSATAASATRSTDWPLTAAGGLELLDRCVRRLDRRASRRSTRGARPPGRAARGTVRRVPVRRADPAHQPGGDPPRRRDRLLRDLYAHQTGGNPMTTPFQICIDADDPHRLNRFWAAAMGYEIEDHHDQMQQMRRCRLRHRRRRRPRSTAAWRGARPRRAATRRASRPRLLFQQVPEPKTVKNRVHLDLHVGERPPRGRGRAADRRSARPGSGTVSRARTAGSRWPTPRATSSASPDPRTR